MSKCINCGKKLNFYSEWADPYGLAVLCKENCLPLFSAHVFDLMSLDYDLELHRSALIDNGATEDGLCYAAAHVSAFKEATRKAAVAQEEQDAIATAKQVAELQEAMRQARMNAFRCDTPDENGVYYHIDGARGRVLDVYYNKCVITTNVTLGSIITNNATDGEKTIYYVDCTSLQYKKPGLALGYLQLETSGSTMNNKDSNFFNENSFTFNEDASVPEAVGNIISTAEKMEVVLEFIKSRLDEIKCAQSAQGAVATVEALKGFKELLDNGAITKEEFDTKKKQLLGL